MPAAEQRNIPVMAYSAAELAAYAELEQQAAGILRERLVGLNVPKLRFEPTDDDILVYRLPPRERRSKGGHIILPTFTLDQKDLDSSQKTDNEIVSDVGVLFAAGCAARDWMRCHGVFLGDYVRFGHYAGREQDAHLFDLVHDIEGDLKSILQLQAKDIRGSFDLHWRVNGDRYEKDGKKHETRAVLRRVFVHDAEGNGLTLFKPIVNQKRRRSRS